MPASHAPRPASGSPRRLLRALLGLGLLACVPDSAPLPTGIADPGATETPAGAMAAYRGTIVQFRDAFSAPGGFVQLSGLLTDELLYGPFIGTPAGYGGGGGPDMRSLPEATTAADDFGDEFAPLFGQLNRVRGQANQARGLLRDFAPAAPPAIRGHLFALSGYSETLLAELYCSGIPLSTLDYRGDFTLEPGSPTDTVLTRAVADFDSALAIGGDSVRIINLARVGKARALLALGRLTEAAEVAALVPNGFSYQVSHEPEIASNLGYIKSGSSWNLSVSDHEGINGLLFRGGDPRTAATVVETNSWGVSLWHPDKYPADGGTDVVLADWVEARLIQAEAALAANDPSWLTTLNTLRQTAITPALADTTDPGPAGQLDLLYHERAFWLFLTGHRQGDMRRLIHHYGRPAALVYPTGQYTGGGVFYGNDITAPIPGAERERNRKFTGCQGRGA